MTSAVTPRVQRAVSEYEQADADLKAFMEAHDELFAEFMRLVQVRNNACDRAKDSVKTAGVTHGDFRFQVSKAPVFDIEILKGNVTPAIFRRITKTVVDNSAVNSLIDRGELTEEELQGSYEMKETKKCYGPKPWNMV